MTYRELFETIRYDICFCLHLCIEYIIWRHIHILHTRISGDCLLFICVLRTDAFKIHISVDPSNPLMRYTDEWRRRRTRVQCPPIFPINFKLNNCFYQQNHNRTKMANEYGDGADAIFNVSTYNDFNLSQMYLLFKHASLPLPPPSSPDECSFLFSFNETNTMESGSQSAIAHHSGYFERCNDIVSHTRHNTHPISQPNKRHSHPRVISLLSEKSRCCWYAFPLLVLCPAHTQLSADTIIALYQCLIFFCKYVQYAIPNIRFIWIRFCGSRSISKKKDTSHIRFKNPTTYS